MPIDTDVKRLMANYEFVPKNKKKYVYDTLYATIRNFDFLSTVTFEFQAGKYDHVITDILARCTSINEMITINNEVVDMIKKCAILSEKHKSTHKAHHDLKRMMKEFMAKHKIRKDNTFDGNAALDEALTGMFD